MQEPQTAPGGAPSARESLGQCRRCLATMLDRLEELTAELLSPPPAASADLPARARALVSEIDEALAVHLADEEKDAFPAVLAAAGSPARRSQAFEVVSSLLVEHRDLSELWHALRVPILAIASGVCVALPGGTAADFLVRMRSHLAREESEFADLVGLIGDPDSRRIAADIARRHRDACPRTPTCPRRG